MSDFSIFKYGEGYNCSDYLHCDSLDVYAQQDDQFVRYEEALSKLADLREELARKDKVIEDMLESNGDMVQCLQSAEQSRHEKNCVLLDPEEPSTECTCSRKIEQRLADAERRNADRNSEIAAQVESALRRSFNLGQVYWQQADSDSTSQQNKCDQTMETQAQHILNVLKSISAALNKPEEAKS